MIMNDGSRSLESACNHGEGEVRGCGATQVESCAWSMPNNSSS